VSEVTTRTESGAAFAGTAPSSIGRRGTTKPEGEAEGPSCSGTAAQEERTPRARLSAVVGRTTVRVEEEHTVGEVISRRSVKRQAPLLRSGECD
jgi:hypothetical protein